MAPPRHEIDYEHREMFNKVLNKVLKKKYHWFKDIIINRLTYSAGNISYIGIDADIFIDSEWGYNEWRKYNYSKQLPDDGELSFGDIIGGKESQELQEEIFTVFTFITGLPAKNLSYSWVTTHFVEPENEDLQENLSRIKEVMGIKESMKVDDWGRLHDEEQKILYPYKKIGKFVNWFQKEYGDYAEKQGWAIFDSDTELPHTKYKFEPDNKFKNVYQVQKLDSHGEGEALFGELKNDYQADELAKKLGLILDEFGVVIGWENNIFI